MASSIPQRMEWLGKLGELGKYPKPSHRTYFPYQALPPLVGTSVGAAWANGEKRGLRVPSRPSSIYQTLSRLAC
ncbi:hypothetical protein OOU_Y34scaffold00703g28 [Pyricularia oryzae Y34]|uniref:Uncharacterized protein n=2 Tax=Pyricularia oryzae TaxID=318829 RepID=A0AA97NSI8_PYRO3|nr:hypothetical protein OOU_Y34scaffold00703g28 [Pyricularia oryzae Y34]